MKTIICYMSSHGCSEKVGRMLQSRLPGETVLVDLKRTPAPDLSPYATVIVGGSIHAGRIQKGVQTFCERNAAVLKEKRLGLFLCCMEEGEKARRQLEMAYPETLRSQAVTTACLGGEFNFERMNFAQRFLIRKISKVSQTVSKLDETAIAAFARALGGQSA